MGKPKVADILKALIALLFLAVCAVSAYVMAYSSESQYVKLLLKAAQTYNLGWYRLDAGGNKEELPALPTRINPKPDGKVRIYHRYASYDKKSICFFTHHQNARLMMDGTVLYRYEMGGGPSWLKSFRAIYHIVDLPITDGGTICLELDPLIKGSRGELNEVYIGDRAEILYRLIKNRSDKLYLGLTLCIFGTIVLLLGITTLTKADNGKLDLTLIYLGLTDFSLGIWQLEESRILQFFFGSQPLHWCLEYMLQFLILCFALMFTRSLTPPRMRGMTNVFTGIVLYFAVLQLGLQFTGTVQITSSAVMLYVMFISICVYISYLIMFTMRFSSRFLKSIFCISMGVSILMFALVILLRSSRSKTWTDFWMTIALIFMFFSLTVVVYQKTVEKFEKIKEAQLYEKLALVDFNTGVSSKTAWFYLVEKFDYEEHMGRIYCLIMFDMNNLKKLNDTLGHLVGDKVIKAFCDCMRETFGGKGEIYRIGGDEFICLLEDLDEDEVRALLAEFDRKVANQKESEQKFTVAYGWAMFKPHSREDFVQAQQRADSLMYDMKKRMKSRAAMESEGMGAGKA